MSAPGQPIPCSGCGGLFPDVEGTAHPYIGASAGCWAIRGEIAAREYGEFRSMPVLQLSVDTYAVQHPGVPGRREIQSVAVHLMGLCLALERGAGPHHIVRVLRQAKTIVPRGSWLEPPVPNGRLTVLEVRGAADPAEHARRVATWAQSVWDAWAPHHETVRGWVERAQPAR